MAMSDMAISLSDVGVLREGRWILRHINWSVPTGTCAAILGPNGSGKSTLARIICGYLWPTEGRVSVCGQTFGETDLNTLRQSIGLVQPAGPYEVDSQLTARQVVQTGFFGTLGLYDAITPIMERESRRILAAVGLTQVADHPYATLSSGEKLRGLIGRALVRRPRLLLLDEPTAALDLPSREHVLATLQRLIQDPLHPTTMVIITHHVEELPPATSQILLLSDGQSAAAGRPEDVLTDDLVSRVYRCPIQVRTTDGRYHLHVNPIAWEQLLSDPPA
jgi:iron complex transport system ATP-binding protein